MSDRKQLDMLGSDEAKLGSRAPAMPELGLTTDHRRLFGALASGWLRPLDGKETQALSVGGFARESELPSTGHRIAVRLCLDPSKLPNLDAPVLRDGQCVSARVHDLRPSDDAVHWPGALPAFAISSVAVSSSEERDRLVGMSRQTQNVDLRNMAPNIVGAMDDLVFDAAPPGGARATLEVPSNHDSIHGALTMAVRIVPCIEPWMKLLQASIAHDQKKLDATAANLNARWWRFPPWQRRTERPETLAEYLWLAATDTFQDDCDEQQPSRPRNLLERIAAHALADGGDEHADAISAWQEATVRILNADAALQLQGWRENPVGLAIQLVLTRPDPERFKTWFTDMPALPPGVAWSAATLCGLLNGYRRLATDVRGCALQRELLSIEALSACSPQSAEVRWPSGRLDLRWRREPSCFVLSHKDQVFARKAQKNRGKWRAAQFDDAEVLGEAQRVAQELGWPCFKFPRAGSVPQPFSDGDVRGKGALYSHTQGAFDVEAFRWFVAIEGGVLPAPTVVETHAEPPAIDIPGLVYEPNFLDEEHERRLVDWIDKQRWSSDLKRRVQHYGWRYDYKARGVDPSNRLGELPPLLAELARRLYESRLVPQMPDQIIINEYTVGQGITPHVDAPGSFADGIATISLLESWEMTFHAPGKGKVRRPVLLERRSIAHARRCKTEVEARDQKAAERPIRRRNRQAPLASTQSAHLADVPQSSAGNVASRKRRDVRRPGLVCHDPAATGASPFARPHGDATMPTWSFGPANAMVSSKIGKLR